MHQMNPILQQMHLDAVSTARRAAPKSRRPLWTPRLDARAVSLLAIVAVAAAAAGAAFA